MTDTAAVSIDDLQHSKFYMTSDECLCGVSLNGGNPCLIEIETGKLCSNRDRLNALVREVDDAEVVAFVANNKKTVQRALANTSGTIAGKIVKIALELRTSKK